MAWGGLGVSPAPQGHPRQSPRLDLVCICVHITRSHTPSDPSPTPRFSPSLAGKVFPRQRGVWVSPPPHSVPRGGFILVSCAYNSNPHAPRRARPPWGPESVGSVFSLTPVVDVFSKVSVRLTPFSPAPHLHITTSFVCKNLTGFHTYCVWGPC